MNQTLAVPFDPDSALPHRLAWTLAHMAMLSLDCEPKAIRYAPDDNLTFEFEAHRMECRDHVLVEGIVLWRPYWTIRWKEERIVTEWPETARERWRFARLLLRRIDWAPS